jgi:hypothetical protein
MRRIEWRRIVLVPRPGDIMDCELEVENAVESSQTQLLHSGNDGNRATTDNLQEGSQQQLQEQMITNDDHAEWL